MNSSIFGNCRAKAISCFRNVVNTANHFICSNVILSAQFDGDNFDSKKHIRQPIMPTFEQIEVEFDMFLVNLDLQDQKYRTLKNLSIDKKWQLLQERSNLEIIHEKSAETYVTLLNDEIRTKNNNNRINRISSEMISTLEALHISLRTQTKSYSEMFIECGGVQCLTDLFEIMVPKGHPDRHICLILNIIKSLLNIKSGKNAILQNEKLMCLMATLAGISVAKSKILVLQILGGLCLVDNGREKVLESFSSSQSSLFENIRFQRIIWQLAEKYYPDKFDLSVKTATMSFVNVLLNSGEAKDKIGERLRLRNHFLSLGIEKIVNQLRNYEHPILQDHLDLFEMMRLEDEHVFAKDFNESQFDLTKPSSILQIMENRLKHDNDNFSSFLSILQGFTLIPIGKDARSIWKLCNLFVEHIVSESNLESLNSDTACFSKELQNILQRMHTEIEYEKLLEDHNRVIKLLDQYEMNAQEMNKDCSKKIPPPSSNQCVENSGDLSKPNVHNTDSIITSPKLAIVHPLTTVDPIIPPTPPPLPEKMFKTDPAKQFQKSSFKSLKGLNWITLPESQLDGTIWSDIKRDEYDKILDIQLLEKNFSIQSKTKRDSIAENGLQTVFLGKNLSLLEPRRAQNCHILLSKLKRSSEEICQLVINLDPNNVLQKDMIEQMFKFIPTKDEMRKLNELENDLNLNQVDHFFIVINRIPRYEQRLKCLWLTKVFNEKSSEIKLQSEAVFKASKLLQASKRIRKLLQIILAIGNHMNEGRHNGDAQAFHILSLINLLDVKSNLKPDYTLMHYLVECCETKFVEIFRLKRELLATTEASKVSTNEIELEMNILRNGINQIETELRQKTLHTDNNFVTTMTTFLKESKIVTLELQSVLIEMNQAYKACMKTFGVNFSSHPMNSGDFFSIFSKFLSSLLNIRKSMKQEKENHDRRLETLSKIRLKQTVSKEMKKTNFKLDDKKEEFEALISALQTGEVFFDDLNRLRTSFRRVPPRKNKIHKIFDRTESRER